jgi:acyl-homoserine-lactone acylase
MKLLIFILLLPVALCSQAFTKEEISRWEKQAKKVTIMRDNYGIPHIYGKTDADAVFGLLYAQCEDDFTRVEMNYIEKLGRMAEVNGPSELYDDLLIRMIIDSVDAVKDYETSPIWMKKLCNAFADGVNYYLYKNPTKKPALLTRFKPWYPFLWTDGSIGAINTADISVGELKNFYTGEPSFSYQKEESEEILTGSNGFAFAPKITESGHSILYINPHVTFYFRPEVHMVSEEGLNVYGAVTWGQFFIYQGFNEKCGWIHTSSQVDAADTYIEKVSKKGNNWFYDYEGKQRKVITKNITIRSKAGNKLESTTVQALYTHHGPIMAKRDGQWLSLRADNRIKDGLIQCWQRTKAQGFEDFKKSLDLKGNISNNTVYADASGNIGYWHGNRIPIRDPKFDWTKAVDGSIADTEWKGYHDINQTVLSINPLNGWLQNCNATPFTVAGINSPKEENFPEYMAPDAENFRGLNAVRTLNEENSYTIDKVIKAGYDTRMTSFEMMVPKLVQSFDRLSYDDSLFSALAAPIIVLKNWDFRSDQNSIATTLAVEWGEKIFPTIRKLQLKDVKDTDLIEKTKYYAANASDYDLLNPMLEVVKSLQRRFGKWQIPWGEINRFQRISSDLQNKFDDNLPSIPVGFTSSAWGTLPSYTSRPLANTKKRYGVNGNSFVCAVEFGPKVKAKSLLAGGNSGNEQSPHFFDQGEMYSKGHFKDVLFYKEDVLKHVKRTYFPGE